jgi:multisubunit Na+/H+ antiporter MnhB subunit
MNKLRNLIKTTSISLAVAFAILTGVGLLLAPQTVSAVTLNEGVSSAKGEGVATDIFGNSGIFTTVINILLFVIGAISVVMLIVGGIRYTISAGDSNAVTGAKNTILYAVIGLVVAFLAYAIVNWVLGSLQG